jgi:hypothetical protein
MKEFLEEETTDAEGEKVITQVKELAKDEEIVKDDSKVQYKHICYHDDKERKPCTRERI